MLACGDVAVSAQYTEKEVPLRRSGDFGSAGSGGDIADGERLYLVRGPLLEDFFRN